MPTGLPARKRKFRGPVLDDAAFLAVTCAAIVTLYALGRNELVHHRPFRTAPAAGIEEADTGPQAVEWPG